MNSTMPLTPTESGKQYQRHGRYADAWQTYESARKTDPKIADYGHMELDFLAGLAHTDLFSGVKPSLLIGLPLCGVEALVRLKEFNTSFLTNDQWREGRAHGDVACLIFCSLFDRMALESSAAYQHLAKTLTTRIVTVSDYLYTHPLGETALASSLSDLQQAAFILVAHRLSAALLVAPSTVPVTLPEIDSSQLARLREIWQSQDRTVNPYRTNRRIPERMGERADDLRVLYSLVVWGKRYIDNFLNICLPSMLAEGNLATLPNNRNSLFLIYTQPGNVPQFEANVQYQRLKRLIPIEIVPLDPALSKNKYSLLGRMQSDTVQRSRPFDAICFLYSDFVWAKHCLRFSLDKLAEGYDGVVSTVPPLILEEFYQTLDRNFDRFVTPVAGVDGAFTIEVDARTLIEYGKPILHPMMRDNIVDYRVNTANPAYLLWLGPNDDLLIRCFHSHPVMLRVQHHNPVYWQPFEETLDEWFLPHAYPSVDRLYMVRDSDELTIVSLSDEDFQTPYASENYHLDALQAAHWAESFAAPMHRAMFQYPTFWHAHDIDPVAWQPVVERSQATANEVQFHLLTPDSVRRSEAGRSYRARSDRALRYKKLAAKCAKAHRSFSSRLFDLARPLLGRMSRETRMKLFALLPSRYLRERLMQSHRARMGQATAPAHSAS